MLPQGLIAYDFHPSICHFCLANIPIFLSFWHFWRKFSLSFCKYAILAPIKDFPIQKDILFIKDTPFYFWLFTLDLWFNTRLSCFNVKTNYFMWKKNFLGQKFIVWQMFVELMKSSLWNTWTLDQHSWI